MKRRGQWHNYSAPGLYMITLVVIDRKPLLGTLIENNGQACIEHSQLGKAIINEEINKISHFYPMVDVWRLCIMPDHIHLILNVKTAMPAGKHLGNVVYGFKPGCTRALWRIMDEGNASPTQPGCPQQMLQNSGQVTENTQQMIQHGGRVAKTPSKCHNMTVVLHNVVIARRSCNAVGNRFLLEIPEYCCPVKLF